MSTSKFTMAQKLQKVQVALMEDEISSTQLQVLLPLIFKKCLEEKMTFWFNFLEDACVLNLRDVEHENTELNIRYAYQHIPFDDEKLSYYKESLLINTFLITKKPYEFKLDMDNVTIASSVEEETLDEPPIKESKLVPPTSIRTVIDMLEKNKEPVTRKSIQKYLQMDKMSTDNRRRCIAYLKSMEE